MPSTEPRAIETHALLNSDEQQQRQSIKPRVDALEKFYAWRSTRWTRTQPFVMLALLACVVAYEIIIIPVSIWMSSEQTPLSTAVRVIYSTAMAVIASLITAAVVGHIRDLWLLYQVQVSRSDARRARKIRALLSIGDFVDKFRLWFVTGPLIIWALITTSVVGSTSLSIRPRPYAKAADHFQGSDDSCFSLQSGPADGTSLAWRDGAGQLATNWDPGVVPYCPTNIRDQVNTVKGVTGWFGNQYTPSNGICAMAVDGGIGCGALGAPLVVEISCSVFRPFACSEQPRQNASACLPVFVDNPVSCRPAAGAVSLDRYGNVTAVQTDSCTVSRGNTSVPYAQSSTDLVGFCTAGQAVGDLAFVIGTSSELNVNNMAQMMYDPSHALDTTYAVECALALNGSLGLRQVVATTVQDWTNAAATPRPLPAISAVPASADCDPDPGALLTAGEQHMTRDADAVLNRNARATAGALMAVLLNQSLADLFGDIDQAQQVGFNNSRNQVEDLLGTLVTSAMGYYWASSVATTNATDMQDLFYLYTYNVPSERIGSGAWTAVLYVLPPVAAMAAIVVLWVKVRPIL